MVLIANNKNNNDFYGIVPNKRHMVPNVMILPNDVSCIMGN